MKIKQLLFIFILIALVQSSFSQNEAHISGTAKVTNNGISIIPTFSLNKPATIIDMSVGNNRFSFDPYLGFSIEGKPWSVVLWLRYKLKKEGKFKINIGAHYGMPFSTSTFINNGVSTNKFTVQRYAAQEVVTNYFISKNLRIGLYYLYSHGLDSYAIQNTHFLTINGTVSNIKLSKEFFLNFTPQVYYLYMDGADGFYFTSVLGLSKKNYPFSVAYQMNKIIKTRITTSPNYIDNISLVYTFGKNYVAKK